MPRLEFSAEVLKALRLIFGLGSNLQNPPTTLAEIVRIIYGDCSDMLAKKRYGALHQHLQTLRKSEQVRFFFGRYRKRAFAPYPQEVEDLFSQIQKNYMYFAFRARIQTFLVGNSKRNMH